MSEIIMRPARKEEAATLSDLAGRSKAYWTGGEVIERDDQPPMRTAEEVASRRTNVAERNGRVVGFYALDASPPYAEVCLFFVDPVVIGTGVGRVMWHDLTRCATEVGVRTLALGADPHAEGFYLRMGMTRYREVIHLGERLAWMVGRLG